MPRSVSRKNKHRFTDVPPSQAAAASPPSQAAAVRPSSQAAAARPSSQAAAVRPSSQAAAARPSSRTAQTAVLRSELSALRRDGNESASPRVSSSSRGTNSPGDEKVQLKSQIQRLHDNCPKFLNGESKALWEKNLDKLLAHVEQQPVNSEGFLRIKNSVVLFKNLHDEVNKFAALGRDASNKEIRASLDRIKQKQSDLDKSLFSVPQKIARGIATVAMALIGAALGAAVGIASGAVYGFIHSFPGANLHTGAVVGAVGAFLGAGFGAAMGGAFAWNSLSKKLRSTGEVDLSTMISQTVIDDLKKDKSSESGAESDGEPKEQDSTSPRP